MIGLRELRQNASDIVRDVESGDEVVITVSGRPSARLVRAAPRTWRSFDAIATLFEGASDPDWDTDRDRVDQQARDPWAAE
ncbi:MAG: type II toxin-antitoxin system prevent-host-death family antitoxin [Gordonia sp. (in: high G+C Gram-positive bacteria)]